MNSNSDSPGTITVLLQRIQTGDKKAPEELCSLVYGELRKLARARLRGRRDETMNSTALVNSAFERLLAQDKLHAENRRHFYYIISRKFSDILVEYIREKRAKKRNVGQKPEQLHEDPLDTGNPSIDVIDLHEGLKKLDEKKAASATVIHLRFFAGLTLQETASKMGLTIAEVRGHEKYARAFLRDELTRDEQK
ncbi:MAG: sigma-70 family RNA polymerase sigma factor [Phycisphaerales bacterium]|nr:sigma-70 family RNA polymerase sigma factor [Phycisphaerales bacterium]